MSPRAVRHVIRQVRHRRLVLIAAFLVSLALGLHHAGIAMHDDAHPMTAVEMCLGVFTAVGVAAAVVAIGFVLSARRPSFACVSAAGLSAALNTVSEQARDGPLTLSLLCVRRL